MSRENVRDNPPNQVVSPSANEVLRQREKQIDAMKRVSEAALRATSVDNLVDETLAIAIDVLEAQAGSFQIYDALTDTLEFRHVHDPGAPQLLGLTVSAKHGINGRVAHSGKAQITLNVSANPDWNAVVDQCTGIRTLSMLTAPVKRPTGVLVGVVQVLNGRKEFDLLDLEVLEILCSQVAQAIQHMHVRLESESRLICLRSLREAQRYLSGTANSRPSVQVFVEQVAKHLPADSVRLFLFTSEDGSPCLAASCIHGRAVTHDAAESVRFGAVVHAVAIRELVRARLGDALFPFDAEPGLVDIRAVPMVSENHLKGILEIGYRRHVPVTDEWSCSIEVFAAQGAMIVDRTRGTQELQHRLQMLQSHSISFENQYQELSYSFDTTLAKLAQALDIHDLEPEGHTRRVADYTIRLARHLKVPEAELEHIRRGALLHNVGKISIPDSILLKATPLTDEESQMLKRYPVFAHELLSSIDFLKPALDIPYCHNERWDGTGFPRGLKGEQIPFSARIFAVADTWDAMRANRPHRAGWPPEKVRAHIIQNSGTHFDPVIVSAFEEIDFD